jgi:DNA-binding response OmpR family regulator
MMARPRLSDVKIVLIEGHPALREAMTEYLCHHGAEVQSYGDPNDATAAVIDFSPNILLCEIKIPTERAFLLLEQLRHSTSGTDSNIRAIGLSGLTSSVAERRILSAGFDAVLQKPFGPADLLQMLSRLLSR